jgi:hypothetical protein
MASLEANLLLLLLLHCLADLAGSLLWVQGKSCTVYQPACLPGPSVSSPTHHGCCSSASLLFHSRLLHHLELPAAVQRILLPVQAPAALLL